MDLEKVGINKLCCGGLERNWSGVLACSSCSAPAAAAPSLDNYEAAGNYNSKKKRATMVVPHVVKIRDDEIKGRHRRFHSTGSEPRLMRSSGVRRDWSFQDLQAAAGAGAGAGAGKNP